MILFLKLLVLPVIFIGITSKFCFPKIFMAIYWHFNQENLLVLPRNFDDAMTGQITGIPNNFQCKSTGKIHGIASRLVLPVIFSYQQTNLPATNQLNTSKNLHCSDGSGLLFSGIGYHQVRKSEIWAGTGSALKFHIG